MKQLIYCRYVALSRFKITEGYQPKDSLFYITSGEIEYRMNDDRERAAENTLVSFPDHLRFERTVLRPAEFYYIQYENPDQHPLPAGKIAIEDTGRLLSTLNYLLQLNSISGQQELKDGLLADIFHQIEAESLLRNLRNDRTVALVHDHFEKNLHRKISLTEAAAVACLSVSGFIAHFKKSTGMTPVEYLTAMRLQRAEGLLIHSDHSVAQIAALCGFENPYYFSNTFKKHKGFSPVAYRKKYRI